MAEPADQPEGVSAPSSSLQVLGMHPFEGHTRTLWELACGLLDKPFVQELEELLSSSRLDFDRIAALDCHLGGPCVLTINADGSGAYEIADREIFRPLQYCAMYFRELSRTSSLEWLARDIVEMSCLHVESLIKRIGGFERVPLGALLRKASIKRRVAMETVVMAEALAGVFNDAKHNVSQAKDTHLFSLEDATVAYLVSRKLGLILYPLADLDTDLAVFDRQQGRFDS